MRLATITNLAYGATLLLTLASGTTMLLASNAQDHERTVVAQRERLDQASADLAKEAFALSEHARQYVITGHAADLETYNREFARLRADEARIRRLGDAGARVDEIEAVRGAMRLAETLHGEQRAAIDAHRSGDEVRARAILFGAPYERQLDRVEVLVDRFQDRLNRRIDADVAQATGFARLWRTTSEIVLVVTGLLFIFVLAFIIRLRVLRPVVRLSDVVTRLAAQDYAAEMPVTEQIDEIGDMHQAIRIFRENGLERQRLEEEAKGDRVTRDLLSRMMQRLQGADTMRDLTEVVQRFVPEIVPGMSGILYLHDRQRNAMVERCRWKLPQHSRSEFTPMACWALRRGASHRPEGAMIDVPCDHLDRIEGMVIDSLCLPLIAQREALGLLYFEPVADAPAEGPATPETYMQMLAENISLAVASLRLRDALREMAMADPLTGLANRRQLDTMLDLLLAESERSDQTVSAVMLDVDHFKRFNDMFGHDAGDLVLREVGAVLRDAVHDGGLAFRYGGEEFLLVLPAVGTAGAVDLAEQVRQRIAALHLAYDGRALGAITASIGVANTPTHVAGGRLVRAADAALLQAKQSGRDRVIVAAREGEAEAAA
ncbi:diguanylate cyclase (GGDEF)-like protein [Sphingomonas zeicaulis]|uniref:diguanylate cyclase n=1 Tax=Sphingomonas zeicaulis TaxID=1632740 RepID=UPI003D22C13B